MITLVEDKASWDKAILLRQGGASFLQSWDWGQFQASAGHRPLRLKLDENEYVQGFEYKLPLGVNYFYSSRFELSDNSYQIFYDYLKEKGFTFARLEPLNKISDNRSQITVNRQPQHTLMLDLSKSEDDLLLGMHSKTRYNIGLSERKGVVVKKEKDINVFWQLNEQTTARDKFKSHGKDYYKKMLELESVNQLTAYFEDKPIASIILIQFGKTITYLHGVSGNEHRNLMAPYLLQWQAMKLGKELSCNKYDFWGVSPLTRQTEDRSDKMSEANFVKNNQTSFNGYTWNPSHKWTGITRFKVGFGGEPVSYPQAVEIVLQSGKYKLFQLAKKIL